MQPLELNLASRPFKNDTLPWLAVVVGGALLVWLTVWNVQSYRDHTFWLADLQQKNEQDTRELEELSSREREAQRKIEEFDREVLAIRADKANEVIRWKGFSWTRLFNHMEEVMPNNVQLTAVRPVFRPENPEEKQNLKNLELHGKVPVSVEGTAKSLQDFLDFETQLFFHPHFDQVTPEHHDSEPNTGSTLFSLRFLYDPRELPGDGSPKTETVASAALPAVGAIEIGEGAALAEPQGLPEELAPVVEELPQGSAAAEVAPADPAVAAGQPVVRSFEKPVETQAEEPVAAEPSEPPVNPTPKRGGRRGGGARREGRKGSD